MAAAYLEDQELNYCSICLTVYSDLILLRCGHSVCWECTEKAWQTPSSESGVYSCPKCRAEEWLVQRKNEIEHFLSTQVTQEEIAIPCTFCLKNPLPAVKTCLQCETSLCESHLNKHNECVAHTLTAPASSLENRKCIVHQELLNYYCVDDKTCVCVTCCVSGKHKNHEVETVMKASEKKKVMLRNIIEELNAQNKSTEQAIQELQNHIKQTEQKAFQVQNSITTFYSEIKAFVATTERQTLDIIKAEESRVLAKTSSQIAELEMQRTNIMKTIKVLGKLCAATDPIILMKESKSTGINTEQEAPVANAKESLLEQHMSIMIQTKLNSLMQLLSDLKAKRGFTMKTESHLTFNPDTANGLVSLSEDLKVARHKEQNCTDNLKRHNEYPQVLCSKSFVSGQHYWEVETSAEGDWSIGIAYDGSVKGADDESDMERTSACWCLDWMEKELLALHNLRAIDLNTKSAPLNVGIYLDYDLGVLSFYHITDTLVHLLTFNTTFTEPVYPAFYVHNKGCVAIKTSEF